MRAEGGRHPGPGAAPSHRATSVSTAALAAAMLGLSGCATPAQPAPPAPWLDALQACGMPADGLAAPWPAAGAEFCAQAGALGRQLDCLARALPASPAAQAQFSGAGLLEFQACLQPLAGGLLTGRSGRAEDMDLALRHCVQQLELAPAGPPMRPPWWQVLRHRGPAPGGNEGPVDAAVTVAPAPPTATPAAGVSPVPVGLRLRPSTSRSWPACTDSATLKPAATIPPTPERRPDRGAGTAGRAPTEHPRTP